MAVLIALTLHSTLSVFFQSFFLHRYGAHRMFTMSKAWERFVHLLTYITQGSSYLNPRAYAILHREHHAYTDGPRDPHSPCNHQGLIPMMLATKEKYDGYAYRRVAPEAKFEGGYPEWPLIDRLGNSWASSLIWGVLYTALYAVIATQWWHFLFLPVHFLMGPIHGAIVNWCGHRYGYQNFDNGDESQNTLPLDLITLGELFQNNHHKFPTRANFGVRWFEWDPTYTVMRVLAWLRIIELTRQPREPAHGRRMVSPISS